VLWCCKAGVSSLSRDLGFRVRGELDEGALDHFEIKLRQDHHLVAFAGDGEEPQCGESYECLENYERVSVFVVSTSRGIVAVKAPSNSFRSTFDAMMPRSMR
jgi:hypothetical protein